MLDHLRIVNDQWKGLPGLKIGNEYLCFDSAIARLGSWIESCSTLHLLTPLREWHWVLTVHVAEQYLLSLTTIFTDFILIIFLTINPFSPSRPTKTGPFIILLCLMTVNFTRKRKTHGWGRVIILTQPVNFPCGRKLENQEKTNKFWQSIDKTFLMYNYMFNFLQSHVVFPFRITCT